MMSLNPRTNFTGRGDIISRITSSCHGGGILSEGFCKSKMMMIFQDYCLVRLQNLKLGGYGEENDLEILPEREEYALLYLNHTNVIKERNKNVCKLLN